MIGVFDSGFGGLTVLKSVVKRLPEYDYLYLGDSARVPYGECSQETVYAYTIQAVDFLFTKGCLLVIIACNTVSSRALRRIQQEFLPGRYPDRKVLGVIRPSAEELVDRKCRKVGILATKGVVDSKIYTEELEDIDPPIEIFYQPCPLLVPIIEAGRQDEDQCDKLVSEYLAGLFAQENSIDTILLSCTHYPLLYESFRRHTPDHVKILSQGPIIADKLEDYLARHSEVERGLSRESNQVFYSTGSLETFDRLAGVFYGEPIRAIPATLDPPE
ncbi:MAG: glutamate racemase [Syntrophobacterales bacterium]|nr:MAG: glutamate racemase [Syntrophobacterales bacterium]